MSSQSQVAQYKNNKRKLVLCSCPVITNISYAESLSKIHFKFRNGNRISKWYIYMAIFLISLTQVTARKGTKEDRLYCNSLNLTHSDQRKFCYENLDVVKAIIQGYKNGYMQCQNAFSDSSVTRTRWNCTNTADKDKKNVLFGVPSPRTGSREASVMSGFIAAGILHNLVNKCKQGVLKTCQPSLIYTCPLNGHKAFTTRSACKHINWEIPMTFINRFFKNQEDSIRTDIQSHNRNIGFRIVKTLATMRRKCTKSGCVEREELLPLSSVNNGFIEQYKASAKLRKRNLTEQRIPTDKKLKYYNRLLHYRGRFSYCGPDDVWKWDGIGRRECRESTNDSFSIENCINMCCGFGYRVDSEMKNICRMKQTPPFQVICEEKKVSRFSCKYKNEARRRDIWNDPPTIKVKN